MRRLMLLVMMMLPMTALAADAFKPPATGKIRVAFVLTEGATMIDFAGPWEVFQDVHVEGRGSDHDAMMPFELFTVGASRDPIRTSGGMKVIPDYTFEDAPKPHVVVIGAQRGAKALPEWLRQAHGNGAVILSVCTGAFKVAEAGLLDGKTATTHHDFYDRFAERYPRVTLVKSKRYVQAAPAIYTAGGLTSGIDLALHIVERYFGSEVAARTAYYMEYESEGWKRNREGKAAYTKK